MTKKRKVRKWINQFRIDVRLSLKQTKLVYIHFPSFFWFLLLLWYPLDSFMYVQFGLSCMSANVAATNIYVDRVVWCDSIAHSTECCSDCVATKLVRQYHGKRTRTDNNICIINWASCHPIHCAHCIAHARICVWESTETSIKNYMYSALHMFCVCVRCYRLFIRCAPSNLWHE